MRFPADKIAIQRSMGMRYRYQTHELNVPLALGTREITSADLARIDADFDRQYEQAYGPGSGYRDAGKEIVTYRVSACGVIAKPRIERSAARSAEALKGRRPVFFEAAGSFTDTPIYDLDAMGPGFELSGPAVIESTVTNIVVNPGDRAVTDDYCNVRLFVGH